MPLASQGLLLPDSFCPSSEGSPASPTHPPLTVRVIPQLLLCRPHEEVLHWVTTRHMWGWPRWMSRQQDLSNGDVPPLSIHDGLAERSRGNSKATCLVLNDAIFQRGYVVKRKTLKFPFFIETAKAGTKQKRLDVLSKEEFYELF